MRQSSFAFTEVARETKVPLAVLHKMRYRGEITGWRDNETHHWRMDAVSRLRVLASVKPEAREHLEAVEERLSKREDAG